MLAETAAMLAADAVVTLSRGRPGRFDLEEWNGIWRGGGPDNVREVRSGRAPVPGADAPEWTRSSLPGARIIEATSGSPYPVAVNTVVTEVPAGADEQRERPDGPGEGSSARRGSGGNYLSNEIAYRNTLLRDRSGWEVPAGHVHLPKVEDPGENAAVLAQVREIVRAVAEVAGTAPVA